MLENLTGVTRKMELKLINRIRDFNFEYFKRKFREDITNYMKTFKKDRILMRIKEDIQSIILSILIVNCIKPKELTLIYFPRKRSYKIPFTLNKLANTLDIAISTIDINFLVSHIESVLRSLIPSSSEDIFENLVGIIMRKYADKRDYLLLGEHTRTSWLLGDYNEGYVKALDILPFSSLYYSQLRYLVRGLKAYSLVRNIDYPRKIKEVLNELNVKDEELLDAIIFGIENAYSDKEISQDLNIPRKKIKKIREIINKNFLSRNRPIIEF